MAPSHYHYIVTTWTNGPMERFVFSLYKDTDDGTAVTRNRQHGQQDSAVKDRPLQQKAYKMGQLTQEQEQEALDNNNNITITSLAAIIINQHSLENNIMHTLWAMFSYF